MIGKKTKKRDLEASKWVSADYLRRPSVTIEFERFAEIGQQICIASVVLRLKKPKKRLLECKRPFEPTAMMA